MGAGRGQGEHVADLLLGDVGAQDALAVFSGVGQGVPHLGQRRGGQVLGVAHQQALDGILRVTPAAASPVALGGLAAAEVGDHLVRELHDVEGVGGDPGVRQGCADPAAVGPTEVDRHHLDRVAPALGLRRAPAHHITPGAPGSLGRAGRCRR